MFSRARAEYLERQAEKAQAERAARGIPAKKLHRGVYEGGGFVGAVDKENASQHDGYQDAVRGLGYCMLCRCECRPQFCHRDQGKGTGIKTDVRDGWPGCPKCHVLVGSSGQFPKELRRELEDMLGRWTRKAVRQAGTWPATLAMVEEE